MPDTLEQALDDLLRLMQQSEINADPGGRPAISIEMVMAIARMVDELERRTYDPDGRPGDSTLH